MRKIYLLIINFLFNFKNFKNLDKLIILYKFFNLLYFKIK